MIKRWISLFISILLLFVILRNIEFADFLDLVFQCNKSLLAFAFVLFVPQTWLSAYRWKVMIAHRVSTPISEATKIILGASTLNLFLPSKLGDLMKAFYLKRHGQMDLKRATNIVILERYMDLVSLAVFMIIYLIGGSPNRMNLSLGGIFAVGILTLFPFALALSHAGHALQSKVLGQKWAVLTKAGEWVGDVKEYLTELVSRPIILLQFIGISLALWFLHLLQFYIVFIALHETIEALTVFGLIPLGIMFGLVPWTIAGIGSRDLAFQFVLNDYASINSIVGIGLFATIRYLIPGIAGIPFMNQYFFLKEQEKIKQIR